MLCRIELVDVKFKIIAKCLTGPQIGSSLSAEYILVTILTSGICSIKDNYIAAIFTCQKLREKLSIWICMTFHIARSLGLIVTSSATDKKLKIDKKKLENKLKIYQKISKLNSKLTKISKLNSKFTKISKINSKFIAILNSKINSKFSSFLSMVMKSI